jgi:hypothetical protein
LPSWGEGGDDFCMSRSGGLQVYSALRGGASISVVRSGPQNVGQWVAVATLLISQGAGYQLALDVGNVDVAGVKSPTSGSQLSLVRCRSGLDNVGRYFRECYFRPFLANLQEKGHSAGLGCSAVAWLEAWLERGANARWRQGLACRVSRLKHH